MITFYPTYKTILLQIEDNISLTKKHQAKNAWQKKNQTKQKTTT